MSESTQPHWETVDTARDHFENAWRRGSRPKLEKHLPSKEHPQYREIVRELLMLDVYWRLRAGEANPLVEDYLNMPEISLQREDRLALIRVEYDRRWRRGEANVRRGEYMHRFPDLADELKQLRPRWDCPNRNCPQQDIPLADEDAVVASCPRCGLSAKVSELFHPPVELPSERVSNRDAPDIPGYELSGELGRGGMGVVYRARHLKLDRQVAVKLSFRGGDDRFLREAKSAARLQHANICQLYEVGECSAGQFIVMEYIAGCTLKDLIDIERLPAERCAELTEKLARAVAFAHQHNVIHRDIKPGNVLIGKKTGEPKLTDFGLAKELSAGNTQLTHTGDILGTPAYMAPEQARGDIANVGTSADVYALGAVLYHLICKTPPFEGKLADMLHKVQFDEPVAPRGRNHSIPVNLETICLKALAKDPRNRYESAEAMADDLACFQRGEPILARPENWLVKRWRQARRYALPATIAALLLIAAVALAAMGWNNYRSGQAQQLKNQIEAGLDSVDWTKEKVQSVEQKIQQFSAWDSAKANQYRQGLTDKLFESGRLLLERPRLTADVGRKVATIVAILRHRDQALAAQLASRHLQRQRSFDSLFDLSAPFDGVQTVFDVRKHRFNVQDKEFIRTAHNDPRFSQRILTLEPSPGNVRLVWKMDETWQSAGAIGLILNGDAKDDSGYTFLLRLAPATDAEKEKGAHWNSFAQLRAACENDDSIDGQILVEIHRNNQRIKNLTLSITELPSHAISLEAQRVDNRLTLQINERQPIEFIDVFPLAGTGNFGLVWPQSVRLTALQAKHQKASRKPSTLEYADDHYYRGEFKAAREGYSEQARRARDPEIAQESRVKEGMVYLALNRPADAAASFREVYLQDGKQWPLFAASQLLALLLRQKEMQGADEVMDTILRRQNAEPFEQFALLIPDDIRDAILKAYTERSGGTGLLLPEPSRIDKLKRLIEFEELVSPPHLRFQILFHKLQLIRAYRWQHDRSAARDIVQKWLQVSRQAADGKSWYYIMLAQENGWLARAEGRRLTGAEIAWLDNQLLQASADPDRDMWPLLNERARSYIASGELGKAENDVQSFLRHMHRNDFRAAGLIGAGASSVLTSAIAATELRAIRGGKWHLGISRYEHYSDGWLLLGFVREDQGDHAGALQAWKTAQINYDTLSGLGGTVSLINACIAASLGENISDRQARQLIDAIHKRASGNALVKDMLKQQITPALIRASFQGKRQRDLARQFVYRNARFRDTIVGLAQSIATEFVEQKAFPKGMTPDQEKLTWDLCGEGVSEYAAGEISITQVLSLAAVWKVSSFTASTWPFLKRGLPKKLSAPASYIYGHRYLSRNQKALALNFFRAAIADAPANTTLARLAQTEIDALTKGAKKN